MQSLRQVVQIKDVHIMYLGTEDEFYEEVRDLLTELRNPENLQITCCTGPMHILQELYKQRKKVTKAHIVVYGLLKRVGNDESDVVRVWGAIYETGINVIFGDSSSSELVDRLLCNV